MGEYIVEAKNLCKYFKAGKDQILKAVDGVNIQLKKGRRWGLWESPAVERPPAGVLL